MPSLAEMPSVRPIVFTCPLEVDVRSIQGKAGTEPERLSSKFGISPATLKNWEQGIRAPEGPARVLLTIIDHEPEAVERALTFVIVDRAS